MSAPVGKGMYIWKIPNCEDGDNEKIAYTAYSAGLKFVLIKIANGIYDYNYDSSTHADLIEPLADELAKYDIKVWGWHYVFGDVPKLEAAAAIRQIEKLPLEGYVIDAEGDYKDKYTAAATFMNELRRSLPDFPIALSSYRYPNYHSTLPWKNFLSKCDYNMPQVYWEQAHNPGEQLERSLAQFENLGYPLPMVPTGAAYGGSGWYPTSDDIVEFMDKAVELGMTGASFWSWDYCRLKLPEIWDTIAAYEWPGYPNPGTDIVQTLMKALTNRDLTTILGLYTEDAIHVNADRTIQGKEALETWLNIFLNFTYIDATFEVTELSGDDPTRHFEWKITLADESTITGSDTLGLSDNKIIYHYSSM